MAFTILRRFSVRCLLLLVALGFALLASPAFAQQAESAAASSASPKAWLGDYGAATEQAKAEKKMLLVWFLNPRDKESGTQYMNSLLVLRDIYPHWQSYVLLQVPTDAQIVTNGRSIPLLQHPAFAEMQGSQGLAILDFAHPNTSYYGHVVSVYPFSRQWIPQSHLSAMLTLPPGTLTQRTLTWAVRTHPEAPSSAWSQPSDILFTAAQSHSQHQANIRLQGHHQWESRFHLISSQVGGTAAEVCAESWPGQNLIDAAEECVHSWRQSPGHWNSVRSSHAQFGYDMKLGSNGIWYATGVFGQ